MKKRSILLTGLAIFFLALPGFATDGYGRGRDDRNALNDMGNWYAGYWWYGTHGDGGGWWWVTPGGGYHLFPQPVYPYPEPPFPLPPPVVVAAPGAPPPVIVNSPYYTVAQ